MTSSLATRVAQAVLLLVLGVVLLGFGLWRGTAAQATEGVRVGYDATPIRCDGTQVLESMHPGTQYARPMVVLEPGMVCDLRVQVDNSSGRDVVVNAVSLQLLASSNALGLEVESVDPNGQAATESLEGAAVFTLDPEVVLPAGELLTVEARLSYSGAARMVECSSMGVNLPVVTVSSLGVGRDVAPPDRDQIWFHQGDPGLCA